MEAARDALLDGFYLCTSSGVGHLLLVATLLHFSLFMLTLKLTLTQFSRGWWWRSRLAQDELVLVVKNPPIELYVPVEDGFAVGGNPITRSPIIKPILSKS